MSKNDSNGSNTVLQTAWQNQAEFDLNASQAQKLHINLRRWVIILSVLATLLAILSEVVTNRFDIPLLEQSLRIALILVPIIGSVILAFANKFQQGQRWLTLRAAAEEIKKEIYLYRTLRQDDERRDQWLQERVTDIQREAFEAVDEELVLKPYRGDLPPYYNPNDERSDPGFNDLAPDAYITYRLEDQLNWHKRKMETLQKERFRLQILIFVFGGGGTFLAAIGLNVWVALTASLAAALTAWLELRQNDTLIKNYSQVVLELGIIRDQWRSLSDEEQTLREFYRLVTATEGVLWSQHNMFVSEMHQAVAELQGKYDESLQEETEGTAREYPAPDPLAVVGVTASRRRATDDLEGHLWETVEDVEGPADTEPADAAAETAIETVESLGAEMADLLEEKEKPDETETKTKKAKAEPTPVTETETETATAVASNGAENSTKTETESIVSQEKDTTQATNGYSRTLNKPKKGAPHAFVVMPFGKKKGFDGTIIDFDAIYYQLIGPALIEAGFEPFRADEETVSGDILTDMFQELLLADLVIADMSIDNANVFYELGVRHAMRKRGIVHIQSGRAYMPFDIFNVRTIPYTTGPDGRPHPDHLEKEIQIIAKICRDTWDSGDERIHSPIFNLLDGLVEPDRKTLRTPLAREYWREHYEWNERVKIAQRRKLVGDVLLLTEEVRNPIIKEEAIAGAGQALKSMGYHHLALEQYQRGLKINPNNIHFKRQEAFFLGRLKRSDEAIVKLEWLINDYPDDAESIAFLGRLYKDMFVDEWVSIADEKARLRAAYEAVYLLKRAIDTYLQAYRLNQNDDYPGINALTLSLLLDHLDQLFGEPDDVDPEVEAVRKQIPALSGAVQFSLEHSAQRNRNDFWVFASLGDLAVLIADRPRQVIRAYRKSLAIGGKNKFSILSVLAQLELLEKLAFRPEFVEAGIQVLRGALAKLEPEVETKEDGAAVPQDPPHVFFFSGHMIDAKSRPEPRFPPEMEGEARRKIEMALDKHQAGPRDVAVTAGAACGGDIIFIEACLDRGLKVEVYLPFPKERFIEASINFHKEKDNNWVERFHAIRLNPNVSIHLQPDRVGSVPEGEDAFARNNRWALYSAISYDIDRVRFIVLWDGQSGDGPGGTMHLVEEVNRLGGIVEHLDTTRFDYWNKSLGKVYKALDSLMAVTPEKGSSPEATAEKAPQEAEDTVAAPERPKRRRSKGSDILDKL